MARNPGAYLLLHEGPLEDFGWEVHAVFWLGGIAVCLLVNLLAARDLKQLGKRKRRRKGDRVQR